MTDLESENLEKPQTLLYLGINDQDVYWGIEIDEFHHLSQLKTLAFKEDSGNIYSSVT